MQGIIDEVSLYDFDTFFPLAESTCYEVHTSIPRIFMLTTNPHVGDRIDVGRTNYVVVEVRPSSVVVCQNVRFVQDFSVGVTRLTESRAGTMRS